MTTSIGARTFRWISKLRFSCQQNKYQNFFNLNKVPTQYLQQTSYFIVKLNFRNSFSIFRDKQKIHPLSTFVFNIVLEHLVHEKRDRFPAPYRGLWWARKSSPCLPLWDSPPHSPCASCTGIFLCFPEMCTLWVLLEIFPHHSSFGWFLYILQIFVYLCHSSGSFPISLLLFFFYPSWYLKCSCDYWDLSSHFGPWGKG